MVDLATCKETYARDSSLQELYGWVGAIREIPRNISTQISLEGCQILCGRAPDFYNWEKVSGTFLTWILPVVGILLQAPFEGHAGYENWRLIARWLGSPMASIMSLLWNIKASSKCALIVDVTAENRGPPEPGSPFSSVRDSMCILMNMNQYTVRDNLLQQAGTQTLLRRALFAKRIQRGPDSIDIEQARNELAQKLRKARKGGIVPIFITNAWFLFSFAVSITAAYGKLGDNATAHDLALGLLLNWIPVLVLCTIVDRNPVANADVRHDLNNFISFVDQQPQYSEFFAGFAAQGRVRFHYGVAPPILRDMERNHIAGIERNWLEFEQDTRDALVNGPESHTWYDFRELVQAVAAFIIVAGSCFGAFTISYNTRTIGIGCRTLGYMIFGINSFVLLILEFGFWSLSTRHWFQKLVLRVQDRPIDPLVCGDRSNAVLQKFKWADKVLSLLEGVNGIVLVLAVTCQVLGIYNNCWCKASVVGGRGGYIEFKDYGTDLPLTFNAWTSGTVISGTIYLVTIVYIVSEWCLQSHLTTVDSEQAHRGLRRVQRFRYSTILIRKMYRKFEASVNAVIDGILQKCGKPKKSWDPKSIKWTSPPAATRQGTSRRSRDKREPSQPGPRKQSRPSQSPSDRSDLTAQIV